MSLYATLGVGPAATEQEIRSAYKKLALLHHPDKAGAASAARFREINHAYSTLSDANMRSVYDRYGDRGVQYMSSTFGEAALAATSGTVIRMIRVMFFVGFLCVILWIVFLSFLAAKVDGVVDWTWLKVFAPLFAFDALVVTAILLSIPSIVMNLHKRLSGEANVESDVPPVVAVLGIAFLYIEVLSVLAASVAIAVGLHRQLDSGGAGMVVQWTLYLIPLYIAGLTQALIILLRAAYVAKDVSRFVGVTLPAWGMRLYVLFDVLRAGAAATFPFLIAYRVDDGGLGGCSWMTVGIPLFVMLGASSGQRVLEAYLALETLKQQQQNGEEEFDGSCVFVVAVIGQLIAFLGLPLASVLMILAKLDGKPISLANALIPLFLIVAVLFFLSCGAWLGSVIASDEALGGMPATTEQRPQPTESSAPDRRRENEEQWVRSPDQVRVSVREEEVALSTPAPISAETSLPDGAAEVD